ncbi:MAG: hypothetical protein OEV41_04110 [Gammaproteobacteria bacterium]|nr:hypothetical protein [Gammaproteobacteria bacterium]
MRKISTLSLLATMALATGAARAQEERLSLDWAFSDEGKAAMSLPRSAWLETGTLVIYDARPEKSERTLQTVDVSSGRRRDFVDAGKAVGQLNEILEPDEPIEELG